MAKSTTANISIRMDAKISKETPNNITVQALLEAEKIANDPDAQKFSNVDELFAELDS